jgi:hypothetical protein
MTVKEEPEAAEGANEQPVAVPVFEKSSEARPETGSEKLSEYDSEAALEGESGTEDQLAPGAVRSTEAAGAVMFTEGPVMPARSDTEAASRRRITVPSEHSVTAISITAPCELDGLITQPVAEPILDTSAAVKPDTASENVSA